MDKSKIFAIAFFILIFVGIGVFILAKYLIENDDTEQLLEFLPKPDQDRNPGSKLIWINRVKKENKSYWEDELSDFMKEYSNTSYWKGSGKICSFENGQKATDDEHCLVTVGHDRSRFSSNGISIPSVVLKLKNREGWIPEPYTETDLDEAKEVGMPADFQDRIRSLGSNPPEFINSKINTIWITCEIVDPPDKINIGQLRLYAPGIGHEPGTHAPTDDFPGIPGYYFPYLNQRGYQTPFVIVQFENLPANVPISVECRAWAKNIGTDDQKGFTKAHFQILLD